MSNLTSEIKQYAQLLQSVGIQGSGKGARRPLKPIECARYIQRLIDEEGDTLPKVAERLGLGKPKDQSNIYKKRDTSQVANFLNLLKVSKKSVELAGWGYEGYPTIAFSVIAQLASFTPDEQDVILQSLINTKDKKLMFGKEDVKRIRKWRNDNPDLPIEHYVEKILKLKPATIVTHLVVSETREKLQKFIRENKDYREKLLSILKNNLDGQFHSIDATNVLITISMDEEAYKTFYDQQHKNGVSYTQFLNDFLEDKIG